MANSLPHLSNCTVSNEDAGVVYSNRVREAYYERMPSRGRPLSYREILLRWSETVVKARFATNLTEAHEACDDYGNVIRAIVGAEGYDIMLKQVLSAVETYRPVVATH